MESKELIDELQRLLDAMRHLVNRLNSPQAVNQKLKALAIKHQISRFNRLNAEDLPLLQDLLEDYLKHLT
jgi:hypothetical protein